MQLKFNIEDYSALTHNISNNTELVEYFYNQRQIDTKTNLPKAKHIPMMHARRMTNGSLLAVELALQMLANNPNIDCVVFASRHGELERNEAMLYALKKRTPISPTIFSMSVHNASVANFTIISKKAITSSAVSDGEDSFYAALIEAYSMLVSGYKKVLIIDFESNIPQSFIDLIPQPTNNLPYAVALVLSLGNQICLNLKAKTNTISYEQTICSLAFLKAYVTKNKILLPSFRYDVTYDFY